MEKIDLRSMPRWEKTTWVLIIIYLVIAFSIFWYYGFSRLPFPV